MFGNILIISGPSGSGKSSLMQEILKNDNVYFSVSSTTRALRGNEIEGKDYFFISQEEFEKGIDNDEFLEWARVHGNYYGTALKPIKKALSDGKIVLFDIDVQGHKIIREKMADIVTSIFITTPNDTILKQRLIARNTDSAETIEKRILNAKEEMKRIYEYDYLLINDNFEDTLKEFKEILSASRHRISTSNIKKFISSWINKN